MPIGHLPTAERPPGQAHEEHTLFALKSGKTPYDAELLRQIVRLADAADRLVKYYEKVFARGGKDA
jgi:hypothetical protein